MIPRSFSIFKSHSPSSKTASPSSSNKEQQFTDSLTPVIDNTEELEIGLTQSSLINMPDIVRKKSFSPNSSRRDSQKLGSPSGETIVKESIAKESPSGESVVKESPSGARSPSKTSGSPYRSNTSPSDKKANRTNSIIEFMRLENNPEVILKEVPKKTRTRPGIQKGSSKDKLEHLFPEIIDDIEFEKSNKESEN